MSGVALPEFPLTGINDVLLCSVLKTALNCPVLPYYMMTHLLHRH